MEHSRAIENLIYRYAELLDLGEIEQMSELFSHAQLLGPEGELLAKGQQQVDAVFRSFIKLHDGNPYTHHVTSNVIIELDLPVGRAAARSYFTVYQATESLPMQAVIAGRYHDTFRYVEGRWRFESRRMVPRLVGDLSQHRQPDAIEVP
jgi:3-phenylpropionate/cinnamic acid dioxygenase small subunit